MMLSVDQEKSPMQRGTAAYLFGGLAVAAAALASLMLSLAHGSVYLSVPFFLPALLFDRFGAMENELILVPFLLIFPVGSYLLWGLHVSRAYVELPNRTIALFFGWLAIAAAYIFVALDLALKWHGTGTALRLVATSAIGAAMAALLLVWAELRPSATSASLANSGLFIWIFLALLKNEWVSYCQSNHRSWSSERSDLSGRPWHCAALVRGRRRLRRGRQDLEYQHRFPARQPLSHPGR